MKNSRSTGSFFSTAYETKLYKGLYLGLGSNMGDRGKFLQSAMVLLEKFGIKIIRASSIYETEPVKVECRLWFYNMVLKCETFLSPEEILKIVDLIEKSLGRERVQKNAARTIDIDILMCGDFIINEPDLIVPHQRMHTRKFVLVPFTEIAPDVFHPVQKKTVNDLLKECKDTSIVRAL